MSDEAPLDAQIAQLLEGRPTHVCKLVLELRGFVLTAAPEVTESVLWGGLSYHKAHEGGRVKGAVCGIGVKDEVVQLAFIHGASLPDPDGLLRGDRKALRHIPIRHRADIRKRAFRKLIRAAVAYRPVS